MALLTYSDLQTQIGNWLERADLAAIIPDFVTLFEAHVNRRLRVRQMEAQATLTTSGGIATIPSDYLVYRSVTWDGDTPRELSYAEPTWFRAYFAVTEDDDPNITGTPTIWTIDQGNVFSCMPIDDTADILFRYYQKIPALSSGVNWLYAAHPDVYLFGCLVEAQAFVLNADRALMFKARRDEIMGEIEKLGAMTQAGIGGPIRPMGWIV